MTTALSSTDITLAQSLFRLFDQRFGGKARAAIGVLLGIATFATMMLQTFVDNMGVLPHWQALGAVAIQAQGALMLLGKFTQLGNSIVPPEAKLGAPVVIAVAPEPVVAVLPPEPVVVAAVPPEQIPVMIPAVPKPVVLATPIE